MKGFTFFHGVLAYAAVNSLIQDFMGKEGFLIWANSHWIDASVTIPMALGTIGLIILDAISRRRKP